MLEYVCWPAEDTSIETLSPFCMCADMQSAYRGPSHVVSVPHALSAGQLASQRSHNMLNGEVVPAS